jgi:hypothetical protein
MKSTVSVNGSAYVRGLDIFCTFLKKKMQTELDTQSKKKIDVQSSSGLEFSLCRALCEKKNGSGFRVFSYME